MGSFTFKWEHPAEEVYVTGTFDNWTKSVKLDKEGDVFQKTVELKDTTEKIYYKFVVDNNWTTNDSAPKEPDHEGNVNNFLTPQQVAPALPNAADALISTVSPESSTAEMAKKQQKKKQQQQKQAKKDEIPTPAASDVPGGFPETPANELAQPVGVNPLPAAEGAVNPVTLAPGEKVPESLAAPDINEHVKLDKESYEKSDALPGTQAQVPAVSNAVIPEVGIPVVDSAISTVNPTSTTAALAGNVPLEPKVPQVVKDSQEQAHVSPEASAVPEEVREKAEVEEELKAKVPEAPSTSEGIAGFGTSKSEGTSTIAATAATAGATVAAALVAAKDTVVGHAAPAADQAATATLDAANKNLPDNVKEQLPEAAQQTLAAHNAEEKREEVSPEVPAEVKKSITEAADSPEAAANTVAVEEKKAVEAELLKEVKPAPATDDTKTKTELPKPAEAPKTVVHSVGPPKTEAVTAVGPKSEETAPITKTEAPLAVTPKVEDSTTEAPKTDVSAAEVPKTATTTAEAPKTEPTTADAPKTEEAKTDAPKTEEAKTDAPKTEEAKTETPTNGTSSKPAAASSTEGQTNDTPAADKKKKNRLSTIFSKIKHKITDKQ